MVGRKISLGDGNVSNETIVAPQVYNLLISRQNYEESESTIKEGKFVGPQTQFLTNDDTFDTLLSKKGKLERI